MKYLSEDTSDVLFATDFSEPARRACEAAVRLARAFGARLHIIHVNEEEYAVCGHGSSAELSSFLSRIAERRDAWMAEHVAYAEEQGICAYARSVDGEPAQEILRAATSLDADVIVMGTSTAHGLSSLFPGSTTKKVLRHSPLPVLTVSRDAGVAPAGAGGTFRRLLYPTDFSPACHDGLATARMLVDRTGSHLTMMTVLPMPVAVSTLPGEPPIMLDRRPGDRIRERLAAEVGALGATGDRVDACIEVNADIASGIAEVARRELVDLIAVPRHPAHPLSSMFFGRTAENLARIGPAPVLVFTPRPTAHA